MHYLESIVLTAPYDVVIFLQNVNKNMLHILKVRLKNPWTQIYVFLQLI